MLEDLGVDISKNAQIDKAVLGVRIDASAGRGIAVWRGAGKIRHIATPTLRVRQLTQGRQSQNHKKSLEYRTRQILRPNTLTADQFEGRWRGVTVMFVKEGNRVAGRSARNHETHPDVCPVDDACEIDTQSTTDMESGHY